MGVDRPRGEAAIGRGAVAALGLERRWVSLPTALEPGDLVARLEARSERLTAAALFVPDGSVVMSRRRDGGFLLLRRSAFPFRPAIGRVAAGLVDLRVGPPPAVTAAVLLAVAGAFASLAMAPFALADGEWFYGLSWLLFPPLVVRGVLDGRRDPDRLVAFVAETTGAP